MNQTDVAKLLDAGFTVLRISHRFPIKDIDKKPEKRSSTFQIKFVDKERRNWTILQDEIPNKAQLDKKLKELLKDKFTVLI